MRLQPQLYACVPFSPCFCVPSPISVNSTPAGDDTFSVTLAAIPDRLFMLSLVDGRPWLHSTISGELASVSRAFMAIDSAEVSRLGVKESRAVRN